MPLLLSGIVARCALNVTDPYVQTLNVQLPANISTAPSLDDISVHWGWAPPFILVGLAYITSFGDIDIPESVMDPHYNIGRVFLHSHGPVPL